MVLHSRVKRRFGNQRANSVYTRVTRGLNASSGIAGADYPATILADNPLSYWRLGESSGNAADIGSLNVTGVVAGSPTYGATGLVGPGTAYTFAGTSGIETADTGGYPHLSESNITVEMWAKWTEGSTFMCGFTLRDAIDASMVFEFNRTAGKVGLWRGGSVNITSAASFNDGVRHHLVAKYTATVGSALWIDGVSVGVAGTRNGPTGTLRALIAQNWGGIQRFSGTIDEVAIYGSALSDARIIAHYAARL